MAQILIVDDVAENRYMLRALLSGFGYEVHEAVNGAEALSLAETLPPDLIISDILMPVMDGFELCRRWKRQDRLKTVPFVFYTATYTNAEDERLALAVGADRFLVKPMQPEALLEALREVMSRGTAAAGIEESRDAEMKVLRWHNEALLRKLDKKVRDLHDETEERRKLEANLAQADKLASMGLLAAGVAHEINNPLSYVLFNLETLEARMGQSVDGLEKLAAAFGRDRVREALGPLATQLEPEVLRGSMKILGEAVDGARKIRDIVKGLGSFGGLSEAHPGPIDVRAALESAIAVAFNEIKYRAKLEKDYRHESSVIASEAHLCQIFLNLIVNAAHAIPEGRREQNTISIRTWQQGQTVFVAIEDTGCGIPPENLERIFEPFFTTKMSGVGSGLGLGIVKTLAEQYSGQVRVESESGRGTRFTVSLPAAVQCQDWTSPTTRLVEDEVRTRGRILVVDDDDLVRTVMVKILNFHEVVALNSGRRAIELLAVDQRFDLVLCDLTMADVGGVEVHAFLETHHKELAKRLVLVTGGAFTEGAREYLSKENIPRLSKPFSSEELKTKVACWLKQENLR